MASDVLVKKRTDDLTSFKDLVIYRLVTNNPAVAHTLTHTPSTIAVLRSFHRAGAERKKTSKDIAYRRADLNDKSCYGILAISAATAGFQGTTFATWLRWMRGVAAGPIKEAA